MHPASVVCSHLPPAAPLDRGLSPRPGQRRALLTCHRFGGVIASAASSLPPAPDHPELSSPHLPSPWLGGVIASAVSSPNRPPEVEAVRGGGEPPPSLPPIPIAVDDDAWRLVWLLSCCNRGNHTCQGHVNSMSCKPSLSPALNCRHTALNCRHLGWGSPPTRRQAETHPAPAGRLGFLYPISPQSQDSGGSPHPYMPE